VGAGFINDNDPFRRQRRNDIRKEQAFYCVAFSRTHTLFERV
jgi:hypothetical protein